MKDRMWFWYIVYLLMVGLHGAMMALYGLMPNDWRWWVWAAIPIITHIAGHEIENSC